MIWNLITGSPRSRIFAPSIPEITRNIQDRVSSSVRNINALNLNVGSLFMRMYFGEYLYFTIENKCKAM